MKRGNPFHGTARRWAYRLLIVCAAAANGIGCRRDMFDQARTKPLGESELLMEDESARAVPRGTVARGFLEDDDAYYKGAIGTNLVVDFPYPITREILGRGRERFEIYCSVCHGRTGNGDGMVVRRGFPAPPSFHSVRLREAPIGHFYDVMTRGYGVMFSQASRVEPADRWAIAAYIRALQFSHSAQWSDVPAEERVQLERMR